MRSECLTPFNELAVAFGADIYFVPQRKRMVVPAALKIVRLKPTRKVSLKSV